MGDAPWYKKDREPMKPPENAVDIPAGLVETCKGCNERIYKKELIENLWVCPKCDHHHRIHASNWFEIMYDEGTVEFFDDPLYATNPLHFFDSKDYSNRLKESRESTGMDDACVNGSGKIGGHLVISSVLDFFFMGGSMGSVVGEKITRGAEAALKYRCPFITISCSGGARMQEGMFSLMQLVKTSYACGRLRQEGIPFLSILTDPSTAGVMASFASLGDLIIAEQGALIGFAGPRVIAQTIGGELPKGFQRADFCREHGMVDIVIHRRELRPLLLKLVSMFADTAEFHQSKSSP